MSLIFPTQIQPSQPEQKEKRQHIDKGIVSHQQNDMSLVWTCHPGKLQK